MKIGKTVFPESLDATLIAACGMNCGLCMFHLREKGRCDGCRSDDAGLPTYCLKCIMRNCDQIKANESKLCYECSRFPCARLGRLDKRYRTSYGISLLENLARIQEVGLAPFLASEKERWQCPECGGVLSVHRPHCLFCGHLKD